VIRERAVLVVVAIGETEASVVNAGTHRRDHREILETRGASESCRVIDQPTAETQVLSAALRAPTQPERASVDVNFSNQGTGSQLGIGKR
jgi:hypothetical protein